MINFGGSANQFATPLFSAQTNERYTDPPVKVKSPHKSQTPKAKTAPLILKIESQKLASLNAEACPLPPPERYVGPHTSWDLMPHDKEKHFPNWWHHPSVAESLKSLSRNTIQTLTSDEILDNQPTIPNPDFLSRLIILRKKLDGWEKAEEKFYEENNGWYCENQDIERKAWASWALSQNRDFGAAVWRWLRLDDWKRAQNPRMKGL